MAKIFISHASEDKSEVAKPLTDLLRAKGLEVWYDEYELTLGDSLRRSIDNGLKESDFGLVILSQNFFNKNWTEYELDSLIILEISYSKKIILPIWHNIELQDVLEYSPHLANKLAAKTSSGLEKVVNDILTVIDKSRDIPVSLKKEYVNRSSKNDFINHQSIIDLLKHIKERTLYLWIGLTEFKGDKSIKEDIKESTLIAIKDSIDRLNLMGLLSYETKYAYNMITTNEKVYSISVFDVSTQLKNLIALIHQEKI